MGWHIYESAATFKEATVNVVHHLVILDKAPCTKGLGFTV